MKDKKKTLDPEAQSSEPSSSSVFSRPIAGLPGLTIRVLILAFCVVLILTVFATLSQAVIASAFTIPIFVLLVIEFLLSKVSKRFQLSAQEWTIYFTVATGLGFYAAVGIGAFIMPPVVARLEPSYMNYVPNLWTISYDTIMKPPFSLVIGTTGTWMDVIRAIPWGEWMWPLIYWYIFIATLFLAGFFLHTTLRKQWIEVERLAFPGTVTTYELIKRAKAQDRPSLWKAATENLWFLVGFFIGFGLYIPDILSHWGLLQLPLTGTYIGQWTFNLTPYTSTILPGAKFQFTYISDMLPIAIFAPMDVLATAVLCDLIFRIALPPILVGAGILSPSVVGVPNPEQYIGIDQGPRWQLVIDLMGLSGFTYGLGFFLLAFQWRRIKDTLVAAIRGTKRDEGEAFSWRFTWIGFFVCSAIWIYLLTIVNVPIVIAILLWGIIMCWFVFGARFYAELAIWIVESSLLTPVISDVGARLGYWPSGQVTPSSLNTNLTFSMVTQMPKDCSLRPADAMNDFKIGDMTETHPRSIGLAFILMALVMIGFGLFFWMFVFYNFGLQNLQSSGSWIFTQSTSYPIYRAVNQGIEGGLNGWWGVNPYPYLIGGFALSGVLLYLRTIFPWFFLNPIGVFAGVASQAGPSSWRLMFYIGFVVKYLALKIGGAKAYEKFLVPLMVGYLTGWVFAIFITMPPRLLSVIRVV